jgi:D-tyrosyl-tRNA(Tyr) deacylase
VRAVLQRVARAKVTVAAEAGVGAPIVAGAIDRGLLVLLGVAAGDPPGAEELLARKTAELRIFPDDEGKMNRSVIEVGGAVLVVSQFTLMADCKKGRRPSFIGAAPPAEADARYQRYCELLRGQGLRVETGRFQTEMQVELVNEGPVTIVLDTRDLRGGGDDA